MSAELRDGAVRVRVPATSANLGPGFDALGLALSVHDVLVARVTGDGLRVRVDGEGRDTVASDETHLVVRAMRRAFERLDVAPPGVELHCHNSIPHSRGLGSSAAAAVAGLLLARGLVRGGEAELPDDELLGLAAAMEGHPDNAAPCLSGGLTVAWSHDDSGRARVRSVRRDVDPAISAVVLVPPFTASTEVARGLLPSTVAHADAAFTAGRAALLVAALTGSPEALFDATEDRLHQTYRAPAMPESAKLVSLLRARGHAAVISGAGPTVLVFVSGSVQADAVVTAAPPSWVANVVPIDVDGAVIESDPGS